MTGTQQSDRFPLMLAKFSSEIARALPKHLNGDRMSRIALTAFRRNPALGKCDPRSVYAAVIQASQLGLEPDTLGRAYLVPYGKECQFIPGWKGLVELLNRSGNGTAWTGAVFHGDEFDWALGDSPHVTHRPMGGYEDEDLTHVYAIGRVKGAEWPVIEVWPIKRVTQHRDRYNKVGRGHYSFTNLEMYARKVVLLQVLKYMPSTAELSIAVELDHAATTSHQAIQVNDAIDGTWAPATDEEPETRTQAKNTTSTVAARVAAQVESAAQAASEWPTKNKGGAWVDSRGIEFNADIHGMSGKLPAVSKAGHFCKRRGCDPALHANIERDALNALSAESSCEGDTLPDGNQETAESGAQVARSNNADGPITYPDIRSAISRAATLDACEEAADLLRSFDGPEDQRMELEELLEERSSKIASLMGNAK